MARLKVIFQQATPQQQHCGGGRQLSVSMRYLSVCVCVYVLVYYVHWTGVEYLHRLVLCAHTHTRLIAGVLLSGDK